MLTDWLIVRRLGAELSATLRGTRIRAAGTLPDGRFGLEIDRGLVVFDVFGETPLVTLEGPAPLSHGPGWPRAASDSLEGLRVSGVRARPGDRLLAFDCSAQSRFGVASGYRLVAELVPRFGNLVLLKGETVVSAARSFEAGGKTVRTVKAGEPYEPPPLPERAQERIPRLVAASLAIEVERGGAAVRSSLDALSASATEAAGGEVYVYRNADGSLAQVHLVPLLQFGDLTESRAPALLPLLSEFAAETAGRRRSGDFGAQRAALASRVARRLAALKREREALERERDESATTDALRRAGDILYAHHSEVPRGAESFVASGDPGLKIELDPRLDAKGNAAAIFRRYKKATARRMHDERRLAALGASQRFAEDLSWELERAEADALGDLADAVDRLEGKRVKKTGRSRTLRRRLAAREVSLAADARIFIGRSPQGNADLTFRLARPNDLWFHARNVPGAHVVLRIDGARKAQAAELQRAAAVAAFYSKGRDAQSVEIDYTERKHVRKQRGAAPGLVWYTDARTLRVAPEDSGVS